MKPFHLKLNFRLALGQNDKKSLIKLGLNSFSFNYILVFDEKSIILILFSLFYFIESLNKGAQSRAPLMALPVLVARRLLKQGLQVGGEHASRLELILDSEDLGKGVVKI